ncbi:endonuclease/exonuclease/phosphatase family protein [Maribacter polysiphoniae]|uniref:Endonuclease/exonuclease/phosphatase family metal-dependent hydrolase n=1 Tax=Maribacter polysiphoniae TaxID=429344 RepID=A0A316DV58_9FLAO|nr:endonuclease/exonuclease/phosphatase family protein [Maribacter polysiphoniae]MBD1262717.1 endonuclease/exonuclease/phosphatase family protein [Maribacter polysiphoniae]PWK21994.1 endonuclease/exonuclease/phosphatase family metal-dependent hydrolase [Maribacter polysiphoniae]
MGKGLGRFNKLVFLFNWLAAFLLLLACISRFLSWGIFSFLSFPSLLLPYLVVANFVFLGYWALKGKNQILLSIVILLFGYLTQDSFVRIFDSNNTPDKEDIKVLTFNVYEFFGYKSSRYPIAEKDIESFLKHQNVDIICLQEYSRDVKKPFNTLPYKYITPDGMGKSLQVIYSKYPIVSKGSLNFPNSSNNTIFADVLIGEDTLRVYNVHLQSHMVRAGSFKREAPDRLFNRLNKSFQKQQQQANMVKEHANKVGYKKIICGDFNNTQFSSVYNTIKGDMKDSFQEKGAGLGNTYNFKFLPFRIDFILTDPELEIKSHKNFDVRLSDHTPVMASFRLKD